MNAEQSRYYSHGKLLLTGEYLILDGAIGLALPTRYGQHLEVLPNAHAEYRFTSTDPEGNCWFQARISPGKLDHLAGQTTYSASEAVISTSDSEVADTLVHMLVSIFRQRKGEFEPTIGLDFLSRLEFPRNWGLGSSSTFVNNLALWSNTNPYTILKASLGGSGYDIACAASHTPIYYSLTEKHPTAAPTEFNPGFRDHLFFVHLNKKQNSREGIARYRALPEKPQKEIRRASEISRALPECTSLEAFSALLEEHENLIAQLLGIKTVKEELFPDFPGHLKSLGAWGGDFILAITQNDPTAYFQKKGYNTILSYNSMIL